MSLRLIVCGDRYWGRDDLPEMTEEQIQRARRDRNMLVDVMDGLFMEHTMGHLTVEMSTFTIIEGDAPGADSIAHWWAEDAPTHSYNESPDDPFFEHLCFPANWKQHGKAAGPIRNRQMLAKLLEGPPEDQRLVLAAHHNILDSKGTKDMVTIATKADVDTFVIGRFNG